jgi:putative transposase
VERVRFQFVSHGCGTRDQGRFTSAICPSTCGGLQRRCLDSSPLPQRDLDRRLQRSVDRDLGEGASGLSATNIVRLKSSWETDYKAWSQRDLSAKRYVYWWADGVYFNVRLDEERTCVMVLMGATEDGSKELLAVVDGYRESTQSWRELPVPSVLLS